MQFWVHIYQGIWKKKIKSESHVIEWFSVLQNLDVFLENLLCSYNLDKISGKNLENHFFYVPWGISTCKTLLFRIGTSRNNKL